MKLVSGEGDGTAEGWAEVTKGRDGSQWPRFRSAVISHESMTLVTFNQRTVVRIGGSVKRSGTRYLSKDAGDGIQRGAVIRCSEMSSCVRSVSSKIAVWLQDESSIKTHVSRGLRQTRALHLKE